MAVIIWPNHDYEYALAQGFLCLAGLRCAVLATGYLAVRPLIVLLMVWGPQL